MNDQKIREILSAYVEEGMRQLNEEEMAGMRLYLLWLYLACLLPMRQVRVS